MDCELCHKPKQGTVKVQVWTREGAYVCGECRDLVARKRHQPYSKVMDRLALAEAGYYINRKRARF